LIIAALLLASAAAQGQWNPSSFTNSLTVSGGSVATCTGTTPSAAVGACVYVPNNNSQTAATFEEIPNGSPTSVSIAVYGCMRGGDCDSAANTNVSTSNAIIGISFTKVYDSFLVAGTFSGGTNPTFTINTKVGFLPAAGSGSNVTIVGPVDGSNNVKVNCVTGCAGGNPNGQATMANSAPVVIASNQSSIPVTAGNLAESTAAWTSATGGNTTLRLTTTGYNSVNVYFNQTTTITGGVATFEASDTAAFTNAYPINCVESNGFLTGTTYTFAASTNQAWDCDVSAATAFQVRLSTVITGTGTVNVGITSSAAATVPEVADGIVSWGGITLGAASNYGTSPGAVAVPGVNAFITNTPAVTATDNVTQFGGVNISTGTGASGTGIPRVTISNDSSLAANQSVNLNQIGGTTVAAADPCQANVRTNFVINITASTQLITGVSAKQTYICGMQFALSSTPDNIALVEGTGSTCGTGTAGMAGGATAATGWNLLANGSLTWGSGPNWVFKTATLADNVCFLVSSAAQVSGVLSYVQQ
jgi:hypothetical protein